MALEATYTVTAEEYFEGIDRLTQRYSQAHVVRKKKPFGSVSFFGGVAAGLCVLPIYARFGLAAGIAWMGGYYVGIFCWWITSRLHNKRAKKAKIEQRQLHFSENRLVNQETRVSVDEKSIGLVQLGSCSSSDLSYFVGWEETSQCILLFHGILTANIIPKRAFTPEQLEDFRALLREKIPTTK